MQQLGKWNQELEKLSQKEFKKTDSELFNTYRQSLIDIKKKLYNYTQAYPNLSFSSRLEVERLFHVADEISAVLDVAIQSVEETIKNHSSSQAEQGYYGTWYALEQSQSIQLGMPLINHDYVEMLVNKPVDGTRLSKRLYKHRDELAKNVSKNIIEGLFAGDSYAKIAKRVSDQTEASYRQSLRIAITEAGRTNSEASQLSSERAQSLGIDMEKRWLSTLDGKTRSDHRALDGQQVPIDGEFKINGHSAKQPRMFGVASEDIRCRCTSINIVNGIAPELRKDNETGKMVKYKNYNEWLADKKNQAANAIIGLKTPDGITIKDLSAHLYDRKSERNVDIKSIIRTIKYPIKIDAIKYDNQGRPSKKYIGDYSTIAINPDNGRIITVYPTTRKRRRKIRREKDDGTL